MWRSNLLHKNLWIFTLLNDKRFACLQLENWFITCAISFEASVIGIIVKRFRLCEGNCSLSRKRKTSLCLFQDSSSLSFSTFYTIQFKSIYRQDNATTWQSKNDFSMDNYSTFPGTVFCAWRLSARLSANSLKQAYWLQPAAIMSSKFNASLQEECFLLLFIFVLIFSNLSHTINPLLTKLVRSRWLDIGHPDLTLGQ